MTASEVVFAINAVTATTGVRASALKVAEGDYRIVFTAEETNKAIQITGDNGGATLAALSASADNGATYTTELAAHQPAQLRLDNIATIARKSVVSGKSVSVRVDPGGRRVHKKKKQNQ